MAYKITFKGNVEPIFLSNEEGVQFYNDWFMGDLPERIKLKGMVVLSNTIKAIEENVKDPDASSVKQGWEIVQEVNDDFREFTAALLRQPAEERAQFTGIADMMWTSMTHEPMTAEQKETVIERQTAFFKEYPNYAFANPKCYEDLIPKAKVMKGAGELRHFADVAPESIMRLTLLQVSNGIQRETH